MSNKLSAQSSRLIMDIVRGALTLDPLDGFGLVCNEMYYQGMSIQQLDSLLVSSSFEELYQVVLYSIHNHVIAQHNPNLKAARDWLRRRSLALIFERGEYSGDDDYNNTEGGVLKIMKKMGFDRNSDLVSEIASFL